MDVNGTQFHLLYGQQDWGTCIAQDDVLRRSLAELWKENSETVSVEWDTGKPVPHLRLSRSTVLFQESLVARKGVPLDLQHRRGAGRDRYGNWYWIDEAQTGIRFLSTKGDPDVQFWTSKVPETTRTDFSSFAVKSPETPQPLKLQGLAITTEHYLVVGYIAPSDERGLLVFDLHSSSPPTRLIWPNSLPRIEYLKNPQGGCYAQKADPKKPDAKMNFTPWDIAAAPNGGVLVLDREHKQYWVLDGNFHLLLPPLCKPLASDPPVAVDCDDCTDECDDDPLVKRLVAYPLRLPKDQDDLTTPVNFLEPVSIESGPDRHVLILWTDARFNDPLTSAPLPINDFEPSIVHEYDPLTGKLVKPYPPLSLQTGTQEKRFISGYDFAYLECCVRCGENNPLKPCLQLDGLDSTADRVHLLFVVERTGNQAIAYEMVRPPNELALDAKPDFLPVRRWENQPESARGLVASDGDVYYDFNNRWFPLEVFGTRNYTHKAVLTTPWEFMPLAPVQPFDSGIEKCVWHRLFLDAIIPAGTSVTIRARASDDLQLLTQMEWIEQPSLYLRGHTDNLHQLSSAELPFFDLWGSDKKPERTGTWELLFQEVVGRFVQLELTIEGTGRSTPELYALRVWFPRFSYLREYLPAIYREDRVSASFMDHWLAIFEGFFTNLEDKFDHMPSLLDPRSTPADALDWLASWMGLILDPIWSEEKRRFFIRHAYQFYERRGTLRGMEAALHMYLEDNISEAILELPETVGKHVQIIEQFRLPEKVDAWIGYNLPISQRRSLEYALTTTEAVDGRWGFNVRTYDELSSSEKVKVEHNDISQVGGMVLWGAFSPEQIAQSWTALVDLLNQTDFITIAMPADLDQAGRDALKIAFPDESSSAVDVLLAFDFPSHQKDTALAEFASLLSGLKIVGGTMPFAIHKYQDAMGDEKLKKVITAAAMPERFKILLSSDLSLTDTTKDVKREIKKSLIQVMRKYGAPVVSNPDAPSKAVASQNRAHRFNILIPANTSSDEQRMIERIINLEKPAHTAFELEQFWDFFRVGEARIGLDTQIGKAFDYSDFILGETYLPEAYLGYHYPLNVADRIVVSRDYLGGFVAL